MRKATTFSLIGLLSAIILSSTLFGTTFASTSWAVTDTANEKEVKITVSAPNTKRLTYHIPSGDGTTFNEGYVDVEENANLYGALTSLTTDVAGYHFVEWHWTNTKFATYSDGYADDVVSTSQVVNYDLSVYAKYVQSNMLYYWDGADRYITSNTSNVVINSQYVYYGDKIYSWGGVDGTEVNLYTSSGRYSFTKNTNDWTIKRVIGINVNNNNFWDTASAHHALWCFESKVSASDAWSSAYSFDNKNAIVEVDYRYNGFIAVRLDDSGTIDWGKKWNQTTNIYLDWDCTSSDNDRHSYTATNSRIYIQGTQDGSNYQCTWGSY